MFTIADVIELLKKLPDDSKIELSVTPEWEFDEFSPDGRYTQRMTRRLIEVRAIHEIEHDRCGH